MTTPGRSSACPVHPVAKRAPARGLLCAKPRKPRTCGAKSLADCAPKEQFYAALHGADSMASRDSAQVEITPEVLLKAYACGIFPMAENADDPALYWIEPELRKLTASEQANPFCG